MRASLAGRSGRKPSENRLFRPGKDKCLPGGSLLSAYSCKEKVGRRTPVRRPWLKPSSSAYFTVTQTENSEVFPVASVAVAATPNPTGTAKPKATSKAPLPDPFVATLA